MFYTAKVRSAQGESKRDRYNFDTSLTVREKLPAGEREAAPGGGGAHRGVGGAPWSSSRLYGEGDASRLASFAIVARLAPVAFWIDVHDMPEASICRMPALRSTFSGRPL